MTFQRSSLIVAAVLCLQAGDALGVANFYSVGNVDTGNFQSEVFGVSGDGSVAVGHVLASNGYSAYSASLPGKAELLTGLIGRANDASDDGSIVVGSVGGPSLAVRWVGGEMEYIGDLPGGDISSGASGVSGDGAVVVGASQGLFGTEAFRWTEGGGMQGLGDLPGGTFGSSASRVSRDGTTIVGYSSGPNGDEAFYWTDELGMQRLGDAGVEGRARGVSDNGDYIVGGTTGGAYRWSIENGLELLAFSAAYGVSGDGTIVVGTSAGEATVWSTHSGVRRIEDVLAYHGIDVRDWTLTAAFDISDDGQTLGGYGINPNGVTEGWLATFAEAEWLPLLGDYNLDGNVNIADYALWRNNLGANVETYSSADGSGNGVIDADDYKLWKSQFRAGLNASAGAAAIPEPSASTLVLACLMLVAFGGSIRLGTGASGSWFPKVRWVRQ